MGLVMMLLLVAAVVVTVLINAAAAYFQLAWISTRHRLRRRRRRDGRAARRAVSLRPQPDVSHARGAARGAAGRRRHRGRCRSPFRSTHGSPGGFNTYGAQFALFFLLATWFYLLSQLVLLGAVYNKFRLGEPAKRASSRARSRESRAEAERGRGDRGEEEEAEPPPPPRRSIFQRVALGGGRRPGAGRGDRAAAPPGIGRLSSFRAQARVQA